MMQPAETRKSHRTVMLIAPQPPPYGGMALQAQTLTRLLSDEGHSVLFVASNLPLPRGLRFVDRLRGIRPFVRSLVISRRLWADMARTDVVHIFAASWLYFFLVVAPAIVLGRLYGKRVIVNYRSGEGREFFRSYGWLVAPLYQLASGVTAPSKFLAEAIQERFGVPVTIVPNIVDLNAFRFRERKRHEPRLLVTRHLEKMYGVESVILAFGQVLERYPEASLDIAGTGSEDEYLRGLVASRGLQNVRFLGHVSHADLPALYDRCDLLLNGSFVDNFPGSLLEASASGLAVVSTNAGGIPFIYEDHKTAILVEPGDWQGLAAGVEELLRDPSLCTQLTLAALRLCRQCEWKNVRVLLYESYGFNAPETVEAWASQA